MVAVLSAMIHISVPVFGLRANLAQFFPAVAADLLSFHDVVGDGAAAAVLGRAPFEVNAR